MIISFFVSTPNQSLVNPKLPACTVFFGDKKKAATCSEEGQSVKSSQYLNLWNAASFSCQL